MENVINVKLLTKWWAVGVRQNCRFDMRFSFLGSTFFGMSVDAALINLMMKDCLCQPDGDQKYEILNVLGFTSTRRRMSVVVRAPDGRIRLMIKGAVSIKFILFEPLRPLRLE